MPPGFIPKEQLSAYTRWQLDSFDAPPSQQPAPETPSAPVFEPEVVENFPLPTAEEIERIHAEAQETGYQAGYEEGYQAAMAEVAALGSRLNGLLDSFEHALQDIDQGIADDVLALALDVAQQVLRTSLKVNPELILPAIREGLASLPLHHGHVTVHVHPDDGPLVKAHLGEQFSHSGWRIAEDSEVPPGGCRLIAGASDVDARVDTRWQRVIEAIGVDHGWLDKRS